MRRPVEGLTRKSGNKARSGVFWFFLIAIMRFDGVGAAAESGTVIVAPTNHQFQVVSTRENRYSKSKVASPRFPDVFRFSVIKAAQLPSRVGIRTLSTATINAGDEVQVTFKSRVISSSQPNGKGQVRVEFQQFGRRPGEPHQTLSNEILDVGKEWQTNVTRFRFPRECFKSHAGTTLNVGDVVQTIEVTSFEWINLGSKPGSPQ